MRPDRSIPVDESIPSIWDGWERQCYGLLGDDDGRQCARGFVIDFRMLAGGRSHEGPKREDAADAVDAYRRIMNYMVARRLWPRCNYWGFFPHDCTPMCFVVHANNVLKWTPDDFRFVDRLTQMQSAERAVNEVGATQPIQEEQHATV